MDENVVWNDTLYCQHEVQHILTVLHDYRIGLHLQRTSSSVV